MSHDPENTLVMETSKGTIVIEMRPDLAPGHVDHIKKLAREKFYDGIKFHRVIDGFMAQTGCPHGTGTGGSSYPDLQAEFNDKPHVRGTTSMARSSMPIRFPSPSRASTRPSHGPGWRIGGTSCARISRAQSACSE